MKINKPHEKIIFEVRGRRCFGYFYSMTKNNIADWQKK